MTKISTIPPGFLLPTKNARLNYMNDSYQIGVKENLEAIVNYLAEKYVGGEEFFDRLDSAIRNDAIMNELVYMARQEKRAVHYVVSGKFGGYFARRYHGSTQGVILLVNGGIRSGAKCDELSEYSDIIGGQKFIFFDDTLYSGGTRDAINRELQKIGSEIVHSYVVYDGAKKRDPAVTSLYRYWDHWDGVRRIDRAVQPEVS